MKFSIICLIVLFAFCQAHDNPGGSNGRGHQEHGNGNGYGHDDHSSETQSESRESSESSESSESKSSSSSSSSSEEEPECAVTGDPPHIVVIMAENFGWNDFGENGATPFLLSMAAEGVQFNESYVLPLSSPTRSALFTGYYPHRIGMQHLDVYPRQSYGLLKQFPTLSEKLKELCYSTHAVGRWQLGFCAEDYLPTNRGFDSFYGTYSPVYDFYTKHSFDPLTGDTGYDLHDDDRFVPEDDEHLSYKFLRRALRVIKKHKKPSKNPLFLYTSFEMPGVPEQVPQEYLDQFSDVVNPNRRAFLAMSALMDDGVRDMVDALRKRKMLDNTLILFISANGGDASLGGNNFPLRGTKGSCYDGGMRVPTFVWGNMINVAGIKQPGLVHVTDWFATLLTAAGGVVDPDIDGFDQSDMVFNGGVTVREKAFLALDDTSNSRTAYREGSFKLVNGETSYWYPIHVGPETDGHYDIPTGVSSPVFNFYGVYLPGQGLQPPPPPAVPVIELYDLSVDPTERILSNNISRRLFMQFRLNLERQRSTGSHFQHDASQLAAEGDPANFGGKWTSGWCEPLDYLPPRTI